MTCLYVQLETSKSNRSPYKRTMVLVCDECLTSFTKKWLHGYDEGSHYHAQCALKSLGSGTIRARCKETLIERYGVEYSVQLPHVIKAAREGSVHPDAVVKRQMTCLERFGAQTPFESQAVRDKARQTVKNRYSVSCWLHSEPGKQHVKQVCKERYGVECVLSLPRVQASAHTPEVEKKRHETMKRNGTYGKETKAERLCYEVLCSRFGVTDVMRYVVVNGWNIDFYVTSIDVYVQLDGVYWHGLDRALEKICEFRKPRDCVIYGTWCRDRKQDKWFKSTGRRLLRITDKQVLRGELPDEFE